jgi:hypothetical protein
VIMTLSVSPAPGMATVKLTITTDADDEATALRDGWLRSITETAAQSPA